MSPFRRLAQFALLALFAAGQSLPAMAQVAQQTTEAQQRSDAPWLYIGSDVPPDPEWKFGVLSNGVRYAVRKNGVPPGQVSIRVRIDAGSLMETDSERGFAHLIEHLTFRGSEFVPDGESKRIWQRLGVTFGSDSNASTTFTNTVYKLDLPDATEAGLDESFKILSGMMENPNITQQALDAERPVVLAEEREQPGPQVRMQDAMLGLMFSGQPLANRKPIGTVATLNAATPASVQAYHDRWYRPERAVVVAVGDVDPAMLERLIVKHFGPWQGRGPAPKTPDFGTPADNGQIAATLVEPALPPLVMLTVLRPWTVFLDTVEFNRKRMVDLIAIRILNRRLESRARSGASYISAGASVDDVSRSANITTVQIVPSGDWETALREVRGVIADAMAAPPTQAEIDREIAEIDSSMRNSIATEAVEAGAKQADDLVQAVDINETTTNAEGSYSIFRGAVDQEMFNPAAVQEASKRVFQGVTMRAIVNLHQPDDQAIPKITGALTEKVTGSTRRKAVGSVTFDQLPKLGKAGTVVSRAVVLDNPKVEKVVFSNGVTLLLHENASEVSKVYVRVRFGGGLSQLPATRQTVAWAGQIALMASGIGTMGQEELDALTGDRQIGLDFSIAEDAFVFSAQTTKEDLPDQLKLFATKLAVPGWDPNPVNRAKAVMLASYAGLNASPDAVLSRDLDRALHSGDPRWGIPARAEIESLTPAKFRQLWEPLLASGPIEVDAFGDLDSEATIKAMAQTFGALKPRKPVGKPVAPGSFPAHVATPVVRTHGGQPNQAAAVIAWPTGGGSAGISESRKLEILAAVFRDRLLDKLRSEAGVSYSPNVVSQWPVGMPSGGAILALGLLPPDKTGFFFQLTREIAADLVANPISFDEMRRALVPLTQLIIRRSSGNMFWMLLVEGGSGDPMRIDAIRTLAPDYAKTTPFELQELARKYLTPDRDWTMVVLPEAKAPAAPGR